MLDNVPPPPRPIFHSAMLRKIIGEFLTDRYRPPRASDLEQLAIALNRIHTNYVLAVTVWKASKPRADNIKAAVATLALFFEERRQACLEGHISAQVIENEKHLSDRFFSFVEALERHDFQLDMDAGLLTPDIEGWRQIAEVVAGFFIAAMAPNNGGKILGRSNDGPLPQFVARVIPLITGEEPSVGNVANQLKDEARKRAHAQAAAQAEPGQSGI